MIILIIDTILTAILLFIVGLAVACLVKKMLNYLKKEKEDDDEDDEEKSERSTSNKK